MSSLFRTEVVKSKQKRLFGEVSLAQPLSIHLIGFVTLLIFIIVIVYLSYSQYARRETVKGYLLPEKGLLKIYPSRSGVIKKFNVKEGDTVKVGEKIATIINRQSLPSGLELTSILEDGLKHQQEYLQLEQETLKEMQKEETSRLQSSIGQLNKSLLILKSIEVIFSEKLQLKKKLYENNRMLHKKGFLSASAFDTYQENLLTLEEEFQRIKSNIINTEGKLSQSQSELTSLPYSYTLKLTNIQQQMLQLSSGISEIKNRYQFIVEAPESGTVTAIQAKEGMRVESTRPLMSIIPESSLLEIELLLPTRSAGFVKIGNEVKLRFDAFPYQKFGFLDGRIARVDKALLLQGEASLPFEIAEPVYRVRASIKKQHIEAFGEVFPLKVGMLVEADIILDRRSLLDWMLEPIYSIRGKL